jgi:hypothetical protein
MLATAIVPSWGRKTRPLTAQGWRNGRFHVITSRGRDRLWKLPRLWKSLRDSHSRLENASRFPQP